MTTDPDPTAHAEVSALATPPTRSGRRRCTATCSWRRASRARCASRRACGRGSTGSRGSARHDAAAAGFDDDAFYRALPAPDQLPASLGGLALLHLEHPRAAEPFREWAAFAARVPY